MALLLGRRFVLVVSFIALGALWKTPQLERHAGGRDLGATFGRLVLGPVRIVVQALSVVLFVVVLAAALFGTTDPFGNIAPTWVYVIFWVGMPVLSVLLRQRVAGAQPVAGDRRRVRLDLGARPRPRGAPAGRLSRERLGRYPGAVTLFAFVALELCYSNPSNPRALAFAIALYSYVALFGMLAFGRETWTRAGEGFAILFAYIAPDRTARRPRGPDPAAGAAHRARGRRARAGLGRCSSRSRSARSGSTASAARSPGRTSSRGSRRPTSSTSPGTGELLVTGSQPARAPRARSRSSLVAFLGACAIARAMVNAPRSLAPDFVLSLVPIALVYAIAHYFSLFVIQGQYMIPLLSDPFGKGWDLFGTAGFHPNIAILGAEHDLVRPGGRARARPRRRPRRRPRSRGHDLPRSPGRAAQPVRDARADGRSTRSAASGCSRASEPARARRHAGPDRRDLDRPRWSARVLAVVWLRERRRRARGERPAEAPMRD